MKNVFEIQVAYKTLNDQPRTKKLYFHLNPIEFADWMSANPAEAMILERDFKGLEDALQIDGEATTEQKYTVLRLVKILSELSHGIPSEDGEYFDKSRNDQFLQSMAYQAFRLSLFSDPQNMDKFFGTILNDEVMKQFQEVVTSAATPADDKDALIADMKRKLALAEGSKSESD